MQLNYEMKKKTSNVTTKEVKKMSQRGIPYLSRYSKAKVIYCIAQRKKNMRYCMHSSRQKKTKLCVLPDSKEQPSAAEER